MRGGARTVLGEGLIATSIDEIAADGVARPTVFTAVGQKTAILKAVVDQAMAGDDAPVMVADRKWLKEAIDETDTASSLNLHARNLCWIMQCVVPLLRALETAAAIDEDSAAQWADLRRQRRVGTASVAANLAAKTTLHCKEQVLADMLLTLPLDAY